MIKQLNLLLDGPGIVIFDPYLLADFIDQHSITTRNLFELFQSESTIGDAVIKQGLILPIYTIPPLNYQIIFNDTDQSTIRPDWVQVTTTPLPLSISQHNKVVAADIYSLMEWDARFYQELATDEALSPQAAAIVASGNYAVVVNGFVDREYIGRGPTTIGYELLLKEVNSLPSIRSDQDVESFDFVLWHPGPSPIDE
jgi:hypothetical protein